MQSQAGLRQVLILHSRAKCKGGMSDAELARAVATQVCAAALARASQEPEPEPEPEPEVQSSTPRFTLSKEVKQCGHVCYPGPNWGCCACMDTRPVLPENTYPRYCDGLGWVDDGARDDGYCPVCNDKNFDAWERKMRSELAEKAVRKQEERRLRLLAAKAAAADKARAAAAAAAAGAAATQNQRLEYSNGDVYEGQLKDGEPSGRGSMQYADEPSSDRLENSLVRYQGEWLAGKHHGQGTKDWGDGMVYTGEFKHGKMHGQGRYVLEDGYVMEGRFEADEFMGDMS